MASNKWTPIFFAVYLRKADCVSELLKHGAEVNIHDAAGKSVMQIALETKDEKIISLIQAAAAKTRL